MRFRRLAMMLVLALALHSAAAPPEVPDPFGAPPRAASPNCGPELRKKLDVIIGSRVDFVRFVRTTPIDEWVRLDDYADGGRVDWGRVAAAVKTARVGRRTVYSLDFNPTGCGGFTLRVTEDGHVSVYGCCGK